MARKISKGQADKLKGEDGARVITKKRAKVIPEAVEEPVLQSIDMAPVQEAIEENGRQMAQAIQSIKIPTQEAPKVIVETKPLIKNIQVKNIERNGQNRIESAVFIVTYDDASNGYMN